MSKWRLLTFLEIYAVYIKKLDNFICILINFFKQRNISSVKSWIIWTSSLVKYTNNGLTFLKNTMYMRKIPLIKL